MVKNSPETANERSEPGNAQEALRFLQEDVDAYQKLVKKPAESSEEAPKSNEKLAEALSNAMQQIELSELAVQNFITKANKNKADRLIILEWKKILKIIEEFKKGQKTPQLIGELRDLELEISRKKSPEEDKPAPEKEEAPDPNAAKPKDKPTPEPEKPPTTKGEFVFSDVTLVDVKKKGTFASFIESFGAKGFAKMLNKASTFLRKFSLVKLLGGQDFSVNATILEAIYSSTGLRDADARQAARDEIQNSKLPLELFEAAGDNGVVTTLFAEHQALDPDPDKNPSKLLKTELFADFVRQKTKLFYDANRKDIEKHMEGDKAKKPKITLSALLGNPPKKLKLEKTV